MARGWESKSVEDQMAAAEERKTARTRPHANLADRETTARRAGLVLSRTRISRDLERARDPRYRTMLQRSLEFIDAQIAALEP